MKEQTGANYDYNRRHIEEYLDQIGKGNVIASIWMLDDVAGRAEEMDIEITDDQCRDVLSCLDRKHDACIGINWDVIDYWIDEVLDN